MLQSVSLSSFLRSGTSRCLDLWGQGSADLIQLLFHYCEPCALVSYCCCNTLPQKSWFKTTQIYFLTVLEVESLKKPVRCLLVHPGGPRENLFLVSCSFQRSWFGIPWLIVVSLQSVLPFPGSLILLPLSYRNLGMGLHHWAYLDSPGSLCFRILNLLTRTAKSFLPHLQDL